MPYQQLSLQNINYFILFLIYSLQLIQLLTYLEFFKYLFNQKIIQLLFYYINHYFEITQNIKYSIYYQDIDNPNYLVKVNTFLIVSSYDSKEQYKYLVNSTLVNPYTSITVNKTELNLEELLTQNRPIGYCQSKYSWYTGQVVDITLKSAQLKLRKSMHLLEKQICSSGLDIKEYVSDSILILHDDKIVKLNMTTKAQQIYFLDTNLTYIKIISVYKELIFISSYTIVPKFSYAISIIQCDNNFQCLNNLDYLILNADPKSIQVLQNLFFIISDISIDVFSFQDDRITYIHNFNYSQQAYFQAIVSPELNYFQVYSKKSNLLIISLYSLFQFHPSYFQKLIIKKIKQISYQNINQRRITSFKYNKLRLIYWQLFNRLAIILIPRLCFIGLQSTKVRLNNNYLLLNYSVNHISIHTIFCKYNPFVKSHKILINVIYLIQKIF